jgi:hypothetical protein
MSVFSRLGYNFDSTVFGTAADFTPSQLTFYTGQTTLTSWQIDDLANSTANSSNYFQNPMAGDLSTSLTLSNSIKVSANAVSAAAIGVSDFTRSGVANTLVLAANTLSTEISSFIIHTNNLSNVTQSKDSANTPDYNMAVAIGRTVVSILNQTDGLQNNIPVLGNFTSLTIAPTVKTNVITLTNDNTLMSNANVSISTMNTIITDINNCYTLLNTRRTSDISFYRNSRSLVQDYQSITQFNNMGVSSEYLIENFIGTPKLISNLNS